MAGRICSGLNLAKINIVKATTDSKSLIANDLLLTLPLEKYADMRADIQESIDQLQSQLDNFEVLEDKYFAWLDTFKPADLLYCDEYEIASILYGHHRVTNPANEVVCNLKARLSEISYCIQENYPNSVVKKPARIPFTPRKRQATEPDFIPEIISVPETSMVTPPTDSATIVSVSELSMVSTPICAAKNGPTTKPAAVLEHSQKSIPTLANYHARCVEYAKPQQTPISKVRELFDWTISDGIAFLKQGKPISRQVQLSEYCHFFFLFLGVSRTVHTQEYEWHKAARSLEELDATGIT